VLVVALSDPSARLRGRDHVLLPKRRPCQGCGALLSAYAAPSDRFCLCCAPLVEQEPRRDPALYCPNGHLRADFEEVRVDRSRASGIKRRCRACKQSEDKGRDRKAGPKAARALERLAREAAA
jgi:hypothetical protein